MDTELLTRVECEQILKTLSIKGLELRDYEIIPAIEALGFLGDYYRLILHCKFISQNQNEEKDNVKYTFFVKSIPLKSAEPGKIEIFRKEAGLYTTLLKHLQSYSTTLWSPKSYYIRQDLLVLQDLCSLGYEKFRHSGENLEEAELKALVSTLAVFHGCSIVLEERNGFSIEKHYPKEVLKEIGVSPEIAWFTTGLKAILSLAKLHPSYQTEELQKFITEKLEAHLNNIYKMSYPSKKYRNVLCHRDSWHGNILFNYADMSAILVDFQTCRYCPPGIDLVFAIFLNQSNKFRKQYEKDYLIYYYEKLKRMLSQHNIDAVACLPFEEILKSYQDFRLFGLVYRIIVASMAKVPAEFITNDYKYVERAEKLLSYMKKDVSFCNYMEDCIAEILDYVTQEGIVVE